MNTWFIAMPRRPRGIWPTSLSGRGYAGRVSGQEPPSIVVVASFENDEANRCVDLFTRADGSWGFEEYRRDPADRGAWSRVGSFAEARYPSRAAALAAAAKIPWLPAALRRRG